MYHTERRAASVLASRTAQLSTTASPDLQVSRDTTAAEHTDISNCHTPSGHRADGNPIFTHRRLIVRESTIVEFDIGNI